MYASPLDDVRHLLPARAPRRLRAQQLVGHVLTIFLAAVVCAAIAVAALAFAGIRPHAEASDSMAPLLNAGDMLWLSEVPARDARRGDVVAFEQAGKVILHRVESVKPSTLGRLEFVTRGDAANTAERWKIAADGTLGRYTGFKAPLIGNLSAAGPAGGVALGVGTLSCLLLAGLALRSIWKRP